MGSGTFVMELRVALPKPYELPSRRQLSLEELDARTDLDVRQVLIDCGAIDVGRREELIGDKGKTKGRLCVTFGSDGGLVPIAGWILTTLIPLF